MNSTQIAAASGAYTEVYEDVELAAAIDQRDPVTFRVIEDEWSADYSVRTIKRAVIDRDTRAE